MRFWAVVVVLAGCGNSGSKEPGAPPAPAGPALSPMLVLPEVAGNGYLPFEKADGEVVISSSAVTVDGTRIVGIRNHEIDSSELEDGERGLKIGKLAAFTKTLVNTKPDPVIALMIDPAATYRAMLATIVSMKSAGVRRFQLVARAHGARVAAPVMLPDPPVAGVGVAVSDPSPHADGSVPGFVVVPAVRAESSPRARPSVRTLDVTRQSVAPRSSLTAEAIAGKVREAYAAGIKLCFARRPGHHPIQLRFEIATSSRAAHPTVTGATRDVADCIATSAAGWRFPIAIATDGKPVAVTATLGLVIDISAPTAPRSDTVRTVSADAVAAQTTRDGPPLGLFVSVATDRILVWSMSGFEGTLHSPKKTIPLGPGAMVELSATLAEIVERRWGQNAPRPENARRVILQADRSLSLQTVAELLGTLRIAPDGHELFPEVLLAIGFD